MDPQMVVSFAQFTSRSDIRGFSFNLETLYLKKNYNNDFRNNH